MIRTAKRRDRPGPIRPLHGCARCGGRGAGPERASRPGPSCARLQAQGLADLEPGSAPNGLRRTAKPALTRLSRAGRPSGQTQILCAAACRRPLGSGRDGHRARSAADEEVKRPKVNRRRAAPQVCRARPSAHAGSRARPAWPCRSASGRVRGDHRRSVSLAVFAGSSASDGAQDLRGTRRRTGTLMPQVVASSSLASGRKTQNSLPSGSASTTQLTSAPCPTSTRRAPSS